MIASSGRETFPCGEVSTHSSIHRAVALRHVYTAFGQGHPVGTYRKT